MIISDIDDEEYVRSGGVNGIFVFRRAYFCTRNLEFLLLLCYKSIKLPH